MYTFYGQSIAINPHHAKAKATVHHMEHANVTAIIMEVIVQVIYYLNISYMKYVVKNKSSIIRVLQQLDYMQRQRLL